jgi:hypothetical protein
MGAMSSDQLVCLFDNHRQVGTFLKNKGYARLAGEYRKHLRFTDLNGMTRRVRTPTVFLLSLIANR